MREVKAALANAPSTMEFLRAQRLVRPSLRGPVVTGVTISDQLGGNSVTVITKALQITCA